MTATFPRMLRLQSREREPILYGVVCAGRALKPMELEDGMPVPAFDQWPTTESEFLQSIVLALRARSKSINYRVGDFTIAVAPDADQPEFLRLHLKMKSVGGRPDRIEIAIWDDGQLWLDARRSSSNGWDYEYSLIGGCDTCDPVSVCDMIQASMWIQNVDEMRKVWEECNVRLENSF